MYYLGLDIGSLSCDAVVIDDHSEVVGWAVVPTGARNRVAMARARDQALSAAGISDDAIAAVVATGYGRDRVEGRLAAVTEISCHARGISQALPGTQVLIDIGGQDSKAIRLSEAGVVLDFAMNDKCAAGTGRFLEAMARALEMTIDQLAVADNDAKGGLVLSSMCTVFAETEVVSLIADGAEVCEIARGLHLAIATRTQGLLKRVAPKLDGHQVAMSGGVARNAAVVRALSELLGCTIRVPAEPDTIGALGAALIARQRHKKKPA